MLTIGRCICRSDRLTQPILLSTPNFPLKKGQVSDEDLINHMRGYLHNSRPPKAPLPVSSTIRDIQTHETLSPLGKIVLENIASKPFVGLVKRFKELGLKVADGYKPIDELVTLKLIIPVTIDGNRLYEITPAGKKKLGEKFNQQGRGGLEHRYYVDKIKAHYLDQEGFTYLEKDDLDLVVETVSTTIAIQVETGKSNMKGNLVKLNQFKADQKIVVATNKETELKIKNMIARITGT
jgi:hypothetical protein